MCLIVNTEVLLWSDCWNKVPWLHWNFLSQGFIPDQFHSLDAPSGKRGSVFGGESMCFRLCFHYFHSSLLCLCTCGCVSDISTVVVCDVGLLHREEGSAPWGPASVGREEQLGPSMRTLPSSLDVFENRISHFWVLTPDLLYKHQIPQTSKIQLQRLV